MQRTVILITSLLLFLQYAIAQTDAWQQEWQETHHLEDDEDNQQAEDYYDLLNELATQRIDLNSASREELEQLPFLSGQQVMDIIEYRERYGDILSMGELRMIPSLDYQQISLLPSFTYLKINDNSPRFPRLKTIAKYGHHNLSTYVRVPLYNRKGDRNGYLGYKYRHWLRYQFNYSDYVKIGITGAQDAGEPFKINSSQWGYDTYSYFLQIKKLGSLDNLVIGKYKLSAGMGLVLNNNILLGKMTTLQTLGHQTSMIRPHTSGSVADYFQGAAATVSLSKTIKLTTFASYRPLDATLNTDGTIATILTNGYHRTPSEFNKKNNSHQTTTGANILFRKKRFYAGITSVYSHLDRSLSPNTKTLYRRHAAQGRNFLNSSMSYGYLSHRLSINGETAIDSHGALATINTISYQSASTWSLIALQRFYSYRYTSLHAHAFSEGGHVQNESGFYLGATWHPWHKLQLRGYADFVSFPWARYQVSRPSSAQDFLGEAIYTLNGKWQIKGRYRLHLRQQDNKKKTALRQHHEHRGRVSATFKNDDWSTTTQCDYVKAANETVDYGWMISQYGSWQHKWCQLGLFAGYFNTQSYDSRIYVYERQLPHVFAFPMYYGCGYRLSLTARATIKDFLQMDVKIGHTKYNDRDVISSGLQQVDGSSLTDADIQVRWRF